MAAVTFSDEVDLAASAKEFRDDSSFYQRIRGSTVLPFVLGETNIDSLISKWWFGYEGYLQHLFKGFTAEGAGNLDSAIYFYQHCLEINIHEEGSYYTNVDLARAYLKLGELKRATMLLEVYIDTLNIELMALNQMIPGGPFGYGFAVEDNASIRRDKAFLFKVLIELKKQIGTSFSGEFRDDSTYYLYRYGIKSGLRRPSRDIFEHFNNFYPGTAGIYLRELFKGYISEQENNLHQAELHFKNCLDIQVEGKKNYHTYLDLARIALKEKRLDKAREHIKVYLTKLSNEIEDSTVNVYRLDLLKEEYLTLQLILKEL